jgi:bifunctional enzyme CysN/CysC
VLPESASDVDAMIVWMHEQPFVAGKSYWFKQTTRVVSGSMTELKHAVDVNTLEERPASQLGLNEVGRVALSFSRSLVFDPYETNPATGAFIIIDRLTNNTVGAGMIIGKHDTSRSARGRVSVQEREIRLGQRGAAVWIHRQIADEIERELFEEARTVVRLDTADLDAKALPEVARMLVDQSIIVLISGDAPPAEDSLLCAELGASLVICPEPEADRAISRIQQNGVGGVEQSIAGEGI